MKVQAKFIKCACLSERGYPPTFRQLALQDAFAALTLHDIEHVTLCTKGRLYHLAQLMGFMYSSLCNGGKLNQDEYKEDFMMMFEDAANYALDNGPKQEPGS